MKSRVFLSAFWMSAICRITTADATGTIGQPCYEKISGIDSIHTNPVYVLKSDIDFTDIILRTINARRILDCISHCLRDIECGSVIFDKNPIDCNLIKQEKRNVIDGLNRMNAGDTGVVRYVRLHKETKCKKSTSGLLQWPFKDCKDHFDSGHTTDGIYKIAPDGYRTTGAMCDMTGGGWTVIQRRYDGSVDFNRNWDEYLSGFGYPSEEHWLGLENIHQLTETSTSLKITMKTFGSATTYEAEYATFALTDSRDYYRLSAGSHSGSCDSFLFQHGKLFSTYDIYTGGCTCAADFEAGWWHGCCFQSCLNCRYIPAPGNHNGRAAFQVHWYCLTGYFVSLETTEMKVKRNV